MQAFLVLSLAAGNAGWARLVGVVQPETPALRATSFMSTEVKAPGGNLLRELSRLLTCETLEAEALTQCSVVPVYEAIAQFAGSKAGCEKTYRSSAEFRLVLQYFIGSTASCSSNLEKWQFHLTPLGEQKFSKGDECVEHVRTYEFGSACMIPGGQPTVAPQLPSETTPGPAAAGNSSAAAGAAAGPPGAAPSPTTPPLPVVNAEASTTTVTTTTAPRVLAAAPAGPAGGVSERQRLLKQMSDMVFS
jgi:hypothetical protein